MRFANSAKAEMAGRTRGCRASEPGPKPSRCKACYSAGPADAGACESGEVAERLKAHAWKVCIRPKGVSRVRIPPSPPSTMSSETQMSKALLLLLLAAALAGCASTREESAAIQAELPQLVAAWNGAFGAGSKKGLETVTIRIAVITEGLDACDRLARAGSLDHVRPATAEIYQRYRDAMTNCLANNTAITA